MTKTTTGYTYTEKPSALTAVRTDGGGDLEGADCGERAAELRELA